VLRSTDATTVERIEETHALPANVSLAIMALSWLRIINSPGF